MYFSNNLLRQSEGVIGGGLLTESHRKWLTTQPDSYRLDWASKEAMTICMVDAMDFVLELPNGDGTNYAVYHFREGVIDYYIFYIHIKNARRGTIRRNEKVCDYTNYFVHIHIKEGGYSSGVSNYLHYLLYFEPTIKITTNYGSSAYTGLNKGEQIPTGINITDFNMATLQIPLKLKSTNTVNMNVRSQPTSKSQDIGDVPPATTWETTRVADGEDIQGVKTWYGYGGGWVSGKWVQEIGTNCSTVEAQLAVAMKKNEALMAELAKYKPIERIYQKDA